jgi:hypothetical protein
MCGGQCSSECSSGCSIGISLSQIPVHISWDVLGSQNLQTSQHAELLFVAWVAAVISESCGGSLVVLCCLALVIFVGLEVGSSGHRFLIGGLVDKPYL